MLQSLKIQNIALIPQVEIEFGSNLNVLSGETGAGKSIIIGSFNFILGEKLKKEVIRSGANFAKVDAVFSETTETLSAITEISGIEFADDTVIVSRVLKSDGKSESRINGDIVTTAVLKDVASRLINIHGQHEHEVLLKPKKHLDILDSFGQEKINATKGQYHAEFAKLKELERGLKSFGGSDAERGRMIDMYTYQINEIEAARLVVGEDDELMEYKRVAQNFEKISNALNSAKQMLDTERGALDLFKTALHSIGTVSNLDAKIEKIYDNAKRVQYDLDDISDSLMSHLDDCEFDEEKFKSVDERLDIIKSLKKKYGVTISDILAFLDEANEKLSFLNRSADDIEKTKKDIEVQKQKLVASASVLTDERKTSAQILQGELQKALSELGMPSARVALDFRTTEPQSNGADEVQFLFSANAGEIMKPLADVISGGEMSRFMLALKTITARPDQTPTLVFDEIDTGIGGTMGLNIATKMAKISRSAQVIVVTHLPQIAAMADTHFLIEKSEVDGRTLTQINELDDEAQIAELSRMLGGAATQSTAREHANQMKKWASEIKNN
jgi:DNA repair protein RecN (Recombination protein N)